MPKEQDKNKKTEDNISPEWVSALSEALSFYGIILKAAQSDCECEVCREAKKYAESLQKRLSLLKPLF